MMARLLREAGKVPARQLHLLGGGLLIVLAAALWFYALRAPLAALRTVRAEHQRLEAGGADPRQLKLQVAALEADIKTLSTRLGIGAVRPPAAQAMVMLVSDINRLALAHGIGLNAVTPVPDQQSVVFERVAFDADATGSYSALLAWMAAIEAAQPNLAVAGFDMQNAKTPGQIHMKIRIAAYRPQDSAP